MYGKHIQMQRKYAWYGDRPFSYAYSGLARVAQTWTRELITIKKLVEQHSQEQFNSCLLNLYHTGDEGMGWHSDNEKELVKGAAIASVSLGAERRFDFKHRTLGTKVSISLAHGSLLLMDAESQQHWLHQLPKTKKVTDPRINLTFRSMQGWTVVN
jgi:alkylated DNA repair dioxygenase AlkB